MKIAVTIFPRPAFICCCSLCGAAVPVVSTEITTSPRRQMKGKHTEITKGGKPLRPTLWSSLIPSSTWLLHAAQACGWQTGIHTGHTHEYPNQIPQRARTVSLLTLGQNNLHSSSSASRLHFFCALTSSESTFPNFPETRCRKKKNI